MRLLLVGCNHHTAPVAIREKLAFTPDQAIAALAQIRERFPKSEAVLLSTCNRVELYLAADDAQRLPSHHDVVDFLAGFHGLDPVEILDELFEHSGEDAIRHLFTVAASLDSMVVGEPQILSQVKQAYELATTGNSAGGLTHSAFQAAIRVAKRVTNETAIHQKRVSIPSIAVCDFASGIFERFDDKQVLVIGAGEMAEETLRYLVDAGAKKIDIVNRNLQRASELAASWKGVAHDWQQLPQRLTAADLVVSTTGASEPIVTSVMFRTIEQHRFQRPLFVLDLAVPRDFDPQIGDFPGVYLYSVDDLAKACDANKAARQKEWPKAERIIEEETQRFMTELHLRSTAPTIKLLRERAEEIKTEEMTRLLNKLVDLDPKHRAEIERSFDRLVNKLLHPPLESLRLEAQEGPPHGLIDALKRLFKLAE
jgi:glutamyl-tRNA reductase